MSLYVNSLLVILAACAWTESQASQDAAPGFRCQFHVEANTGETCERIATERGVSISEIKKWNTDCSSIRLGDPVCVLAVDMPTSGRESGRGGLTPARSGSDDSTGSGMSRGSGDRHDHKETIVRDARPT
ncbi:hypothetical protein RvY_03518 [Ramazzottius varieornatus]|uniref:LysM domain-containing protein n=1 Tax=Ramazzottius varieornatus TaxID=947166 RepID=A0A1D1UNC8_RAMVA|nr:hypothetical protein RvY_03518 [Ramazzottius varieornatus]